MEGEEKLAAVRPLNLGQQAEQGGLAGAVAPRQAQALARREDEAGGGQYLPAPVALAQLAYLQHEVR